MAPRNYIFRNGSEISNRFFVTIPSIGQTFWAEGRMFEIIEVRPSIDMIIVRDIEEL